jgi:nitrogen-specific signal transduction histidine kinase
LDLFAVPHFLDAHWSLSEARKGKLFTPMFTTKAKGQGFGLSVVKSMTEALGGTVSFESRRQRNHIQGMFAHHPKS